MGFLLRCYLSTFLCTSATLLFPACTSCEGGGEAPHTQPLQSMLLFLSQSARSQQPSRRAVKVFKECWNTCRADCDCFFDFIASGRYRSPVSKFVRKFYWVSYQQSSSSLFQKNNAGPVNTDASETPCTQFWEQKIWGFLSHNLFMLCLQGQFNLPYKEEFVF